MAKKDFIPEWQRDKTAYLYARSFIDGVDKLAIDMERKWGVDRLRLLVGQELRNKFDNQRLKFNHALNHGDLEEVKLQTKRMANAWHALDRAAAEAGEEPISTDVWEYTLADGSVLAVVRDDEAVRHLKAEGRHVMVYGLAEIAMLINGYGEALQAVKKEFPGAQVTKVTRPDDPVEAIVDGVLDDDLDEILPLTMAG